jgi:hypothetical protein
MLCARCPSRCYRLELQDCELREVLVWVQREQPHDVAFSCRLGEVMVRH